MDFNIYHSLGGFVFYFLFTIFLNSYFFLALLQVVDDGHIHDVRIYLRSLHILMPQQLLHRGDVHSPVDEQ